MRKLEAARDEDASLWLCYGESGAGTEAPSRLEVRPRFLYQNKERSYLEAECLRSGMLKTYRLDRIQRADASS